MRFAERGTCRLFAALIVAGGALAIASPRTASAQSNACSYELLTYGHDPAAPAAVLPPRGPYETARDSTFVLRKLAENSGQAIREFEQQRLALRAQVQMHDANRRGRRKDPPEIAEARAQLTAMESNADPVMALAGRETDRRVAALKEIAPVVKAGYAALPSDLQGLRTAVKSATVFADWSACTQWTTFGQSGQRFASFQAEADQILAEMRQDLTTAVLARISANAEELLGIISNVKSSTEALAFRSTYLDTDVRDLNISIANTGLTAALEEQHRRMATIEQLTEELVRVNDAIATGEAQLDFFGSKDWHVRSGPGERFAVVGYRVVEGVTYQTTLTCLLRPIPAVRVEVMIDHKAAWQWRDLSVGTIELFITNDGKRERHVAGFVGEDRTKYVNHMQFLFIDGPKLEARLGEQIEDGDLLGAFTTLTAPRFDVPLETTRSARELLISAYAGPADRAAAEVTVADLGSAAGPGLDRFARACGGPLGR